MSNKFDGNYNFLDELALEDYFMSRKYMKVIMNENPKNPIISITDFQKSMNELIDKKIEELNNHSKIIIANLLGEMIPINCPQEKKMHYRKLKFISFLYNKVLVKKNNLLISWIKTVKKDVLSLVHICSIFPFIEKKIDFTRESTLEKIYTEVKKEVELEYNEITAEYSTKVIKALNFFTDSAIEELVTQKIDYLSPITEDTSFLFYCLINSNDFPIKPIIDDFINNIQEETFIRNITDITIKIIESMHYKQVLFKLIAQYLVKFTFSQTNYIFKPLLEFSSFFPESKNKSIADFDIPSHLTNKDMPNDTKLFEYINQNELLKEASSEFFQCIFEPTPIDVLIRVDKVIRKINIFITNMVKEDGKILAFIPFDDTFILFCAAIVVSEFPNFVGLVQFVTVFLDDNLLVNELSFAQTALRGAAEWQKSRQNRL